MPTALVYANGKLLVNVDERLNVSDLFWPHIGEDNQLTWKSNEIFVWVDGELTSLADDHWQINYDYQDNSLVGEATLISERFGVELKFVDLIVPNNDSFIRNIQVNNLWNKDRELKIFFKHNFYIKEDDTGNTAAWYPFTQTVVHYKKHIYIAAGFIEKIYQYSCTGPDDNNGGGAIPDSQTGELWSNPIATGSTQSCISYKVSLNKQSSSNFSYFLTCGKSYGEIGYNSEVIRSKTFQEHLDITTKSWSSWLGQHDDSVHIFDEEERNKLCLKLYNRSQLIIRSQIDNGGAVIAANDSSYIKDGGKDSYSYFWPRDGAYTMFALMGSGHFDEAKRFFRFCADVLSPEGYLFHKYYANKRHGLASSWLPWVDHQGNPQLPIQQDETNLVIIAFAQYIKETNDLKLLEELWSSLVVKITHFLLNYRYAKNEPSQNTPLEVDLHGSQLPRPSHDIWEIHWGVHSYTVATLHKALESIEYLYDKKQFSQVPNQSRRIRHLIKDHYNSMYWNESKQSYMRSIYCDPYDEVCTRSETIDASLFGLVRFGMFDVTDERLVKTMEAVERELSVKTNIGGVGRYEDDHYVRIDEGTNGNPWIITTLWMAQYHILAGNLDKAKEYIYWVMSHTDHTGLMAEQIHPHSGYGLSMKPLTWSHAEFVYTITLLS